MICPACGKTMFEKDFGGAKVDVCDGGCKSLWFDWMELARLDEKHEGFGQALEDALNDHRRNDENRGQLKCPKCATKMKQHLYQKSKAVTVDECYNCGGFFLDSGELRTIRDTYMNEDQLEKYVDDLIRQTPESKDFFRKISDNRERIQKFEARGASLRKIFNKLGEKRIAG